MRSAFALGGLAGVNLHGAGFLRAALESDHRPALLSCTSGAIAWVAAYLEAAKLPRARGLAYLDAAAERLVAQTNPLPPFLRPFDASWLAVTGIPGIFTPATAAYWLRWMHGPPLSLDQLAERIFPARMYDPTRGDEWFAATASTLSAADIPVFTNSYAPAEGVEYVYCNPPALDLVRGKTKSAGLYKREGAVAPCRRYEPIDADALKAALWLFDYGFESDAEFAGTLHVDGAYHRQMIIDEFTMGTKETRPDAIFAVCPQRLQWDRPPRQAFEQAVFRTDMFMNASYAGEVALIEYVNRRLGEKPDAGRKVIQVLRVDNTIPVGFTDFFVERAEIYAASYAQGKACLTDVTVSGLQDAAGR
jgi:hypothetical protein